MSEFSPLRVENEGYGACDDEEQEKALALLLHLSGHNRPQCGRFPGTGLTLFQPTKPAVDAISRKTGEYPRR